MATVRCYSTSRLHDAHVCRPFLYVTGLTLYDNGDDRPTVNFAVLWRDGDSEVHEGWLFHTGRAPGIEVRSLALKIDGSLKLGKSGPRLGVGDELEFGWFECHRHALAGDQPLTVTATAVLALSCRSIENPDRGYRLPPYHTVAGMGEEACTEADLGVMLGGVELRVDALVPVVDAALSVVWGLRTCQSPSRRGVSPHLLQSLRRLISLVRRASGAETAGKSKPRFSVMANLARDDEAWHRVYGDLRLLATLAFSPQYESEYFGSVVVKTAYRHGLGDLGFVCLQHPPPAQYQHELYQVGTTCAQGAQCARLRPEGCRRTVLQERLSGGLACLACSGKGPDDPWADDADATPAAPAAAVAALAWALPGVDLLPAVDDVVFEARAAVHEVQRRARWVQNDRRQTNLIKAKKKRGAEAAA